MGKWGLQLSELSLGSWITFGTVLDAGHVRKIMKHAFDAGINFFDNAEVYSDGLSETLMGEALQMFPRQEVVISTKIFWGGKAPNTSGLSWKHLVEGTNNSLKRLNVDYVDILFCHRPDPNVPVEETVRAMDFLIRQGKVLYWGTSEWAKEHIVQAHEVAQAYNCIPPVVEQPQYNLFHRYRVEVEYEPLYQVYGMGVTTWSPLDSGILTGKYNKGIPEGTRLERHSWLQGRLNSAKIEKVKKLELIAEGLGCTTTQLAIAWCLKNPYVSTVLLGVTTLAQLTHNLQALSVKDQLTEAVLHQIDTLFGREQIEG